MLRFRNKHSESAGTRAPQGQLAARVRRPSLWIAAALCVCAVLGVTTYFLLRLPYTYEVLNKFNDMGQPQGEPQVRITGYRGVWKTVSIPSEIEGAPVVFIGRGAFAETKVERVVIPNGVTEIDDNAFAYCISLASIELPDSLEKIGRNAFTGCVSLESIDIPDGVTRLGGGAFLLCKSLTDIKIPRGVTELSYSLLQCCYALKSVTIPDDVTEIGAWAFGECGQLESVSIPAGVTKIHGTAFEESGRVVLTVVPGSEGERFAKENGLEYRLV